jgi:hypothetical protein
MMLITLWAVLCMNTAPNVCVQEVVTKHFLGGVHGRHRTRERAQVR